MPLLDKKQSYSLLSLSEADGQTTMMFERTIKSCDVDDRSIAVRLIHIQTISIFPDKLSSACDLKLLVVQLSFQSSERQTYSAGNDSLYCV